MKTLYLECRMGAAGDMLTAALMELLDRPEEFLEKMAALGLPGVQVSAEKAQQCGITGTHVHVLVNGQEECSEDLPHVHVHPHVHEHEHGHEHEHPHDHVHPHEHEHDHEHDHEHTHEHEHDHEHDHDHVHPHEHDHDHVHPHEHVHPHDHDHGHGHDHGHHHHHSHFSLGDVEKLIQGLALPEQVKADALAVYLQIAQAESHAHNMRAFLGQTDSAPLEEISELSCNLDDMTAEDLGYAQEKLLAQGARDVFLTSIQMKKGRPGVLFTCICLPEEEGKFIQLILQHTSTRGVRIRRCSRAVLDQTLETVETAYGPVQVKRSRGYGMERVKAEYEDLRRIAEDRGLPLEAVRRQVERAL